MLNKKTFYWLSFIMLLPMFIVTISANASSSKQSKEKIIKPNVSQWTLYTDPRFDFSVKYSEGWHLVSRNDNRQVTSEPLAFIKMPENAEIELNYDPHFALPTIVIGHYLVSWTDRESLTEDSLKEWTNSYNDLSMVTNNNKIKGRNYRESHNVQVDGKDALYENGKGAFSSVRYVNIPRGNIVWFIWSNSEADADIAVFDKLVASFKFGENTPNTLQEIYGQDFQSLSMFQDRGTESNWDNSLNSIQTIGAPQTLSSSWRSPLNGTNLTATCNSNSHDPNTSNSEYAIDVARPAWTDVYATKNGTVPFAGWNTNGFGNLFKISNGTKTAYNAHLAGFNFPHWWNWSVTKGQLIGWVGNTGNSTNNHLHFEVREGGTSISLEGMSGFAASNYPYPHSPCGALTY